VILSGSQSPAYCRTPSFFSLNYRDEEATLYDGQTDQWLATGWNSDGWKVTDEMVAPSIKRSESVVVSTAWSQKAIA